jgi:hypothetical protein
VTKADNLSMQQDGLLQQLDILGKNDVCGVFP